MGSSPVGACRNGVSVALRALCESRPPKSSRSQGPNARGWYLETLNYSPCGVGLQSGWPAHSCGLLLTFAWPPPSEFMTKTSREFAALVKTIQRPSGDQSGSRSPSGVLVRTVKPLPSRFTAATSLSEPARRVMKTILFPSDDNVGC